MHLIEPVRSCIDDIIQSTGQGMKSMLLDEFTTGVINAAYSRSDMLLREVYLFECIDSILESTDRLNHLKCIVILRPTRENIELLCAELNRPHYRTYHLYFTCRIGSTLIKKLSEADETEVVRCIKELPLDYQAINPFLFTLRLNRTFDLKNNSWQPEGLKRTCDGLSSALIALQINPIIRYQTQSQLCKILAEEVSKVLKNEAFSNKCWREVAPYDVESLLIIVDRRSDLITPAINKWSYYAMIHEQFSIINNRISMADVPNRKPTDPKDMLISIENDQFFGENYHKNYGELGPILMDSVENLKSHTSSQHVVKTMDDMKRFIEEYPETKKYANNLHNHVFLLSELTRIVTDHNLISLSESEQDLACGQGSNSEILKKLKLFVSSSTIRSIDALRLVSLYTLCRPEKCGSTDLIKLLKTRTDITADEVEFINDLKEFNLTKPHSPLDETVQHVTRMIVQGVKGVENALTRYKPTIAQILGELRAGNKLKESEFAFAGDRCRDIPPKRIIYFVVGGATYDEALVADNMNRHSNIQVIVGGTSVHNFRSLKDEIRLAVQLKKQSK